MCMFLCVLNIHAQNSKAMQTEKKFGIVIHGGAGTILKSAMTKEMEAEYHALLAKACDTAYIILSEGGNAVQAVAAAIRIMEDSPLFNAGKGSVFTHNGKNEMDASVMDGSNLKAGAVAGVTRIKNPIYAAIAVKDNSPHVLLVGKGAEEFAKEQKMELVDESYFFDEKRWKQWEKLKETEKIKLDHSDEKGAIPEQESPFKDEKFGTVGAVALDKQGNLAAGTSTGGMTNKRFGRVGDTPIIGAGTYADNATCAVSCTGHGEYFMRNVVAYDVAALMKYKNFTLQQACEEVVMNKLKTQGGEGGLVALDAQGNISLVFNTPGMYRACKFSDNRSFTAIFKD